MALTVANPRRARFIITLLGAAIAITGLIAWGRASTEISGDEQNMINHSYLVWQTDPSQENFDPEADTEILQDKAALDADRSNRTFGLVVTVVGAAVVACRFAVKGRVRGVQLGKATSSR
ncbi:hypothetical protein ACIQGZ_17190 [Streptomyces sp. NPDC092296]|uniref:hypothetical protein n=1 Tax=Streptomyces sp. NPDC092296 TaxID=3366012 RepID=UPI0037FEF075